MRLFYFLIVSIVLLSDLFAQSDDSITKLKKEFENFEYKKAIVTAAKLLEDSTSIDTTDLIEIYRMKAISHYSLLQDKEGGESFTSILKMDTTFTLDPQQNSPKIISFFNNIKTEYISSIKKYETEQKAVKIDTVYVVKEVMNDAQYYQLKDRLSRSLVLPGWGQLYSGQNTKGWFLTAFSSAALISSVFFIFDASKKEDLYVNENDIDRIPERYDAYNFSYKMKNISFIAFAAVWLYSQLDILVFDVMYNPSNNSLSLNLSF